MDAAWHHYKVDRENTMYRLLDCLKSTFPLILRINLVTISCKHQVPSNGKVEHNFSEKKKTESQSGKVQSEKCKY